MSISKYWLIAIAGLLWCGVGVMLCKLAYGWLMQMPSDMVFMLGGGGIMLAFLADRIGFYKIAEKNLARLNSFSEKQSIFTFIPLKSYFMIAIMIPLGFMLRHSTIPKQYLAVIYITMGGALFLSSLRYFSCLLHAFAKSSPGQASAVQERAEENHQ